MSKLKTPQEKKAASLELDRRNTFGDNDKSSRKNIPRSRKLSHQTVRRASNQPLRKVHSAANEDHADAIELEVRNADLEKSRKAFRKHPDATLRDALIYQSTGKLPAKRK